MTVAGVLTTDPTVRTAGTGPRRSAYVVGRLRVDEVTGRGACTPGRALVLLHRAPLGDLRPGQRVVAAAGSDLRTAGATSRACSGFATRRARGSAGLGQYRHGAVACGTARGGSRASEGPRGLVPALVVGDESLMADRVRDDMRASGLLHLNAVSGTNDGRSRRRPRPGPVGRGPGHGLPALGVSAVAGFVLLARPEPSVVRAAVMGTVALVGLTASGRRRGVPTLAAVLVLLLLDPWLGTDGRVCAVGASDRRHSPAGARVARRHAVGATASGRGARGSLAAQVACVPVVVVVATQASLASIPANIVVAPAVAPATVLGAAAAVVSTVSPPVASGLGWLAGLPATWIVVVARHAADLPGAVVRWQGTGVLLAAGLTVVSALILPALLRRPLTASAAGGALLILLVWAPTPGWPPHRWLVVACDVGQGDALVLRAGDASAVVVDAGPEPRAVDRCLDSLGIEQVPLLVLTHFHADHVDGLPGVLDGREVGHVLVSPLDDPANSPTTWRAACPARVPVAVARAGDQITVGDAVRLRVLWPRRIITAGSMANNASVVLAADVDGVRIVLAGDVEPEAQRALLAAEPGLRADVLKVPHHGSAHQDADLLRGLGARVALISAGADLLRPPGARDRRSPRRGRCRGPAHRCRRIDRRRPDDR